MKIWKFRNRELALSFAERGRCLAVVLGDDLKFWVVTIAHAARLERLGFEVVF